MADLALYFAHVCQTQPADGSERAPPLHGGASCPERHRRLAAVARRQPRRRSQHVPSACQVARIADDEVAPRGGRGIQHTSPRWRDGVRVRAAGRRRQRDRHRVRGHQRQAAVAGALSGAVHRRQSGGRPRVGSEGHAVVRGRPALHVRHQRDPHRVRRQVREGPVAEAGARRRAHVHHVAVAARRLRTPDRPRRRRQGGALRPSTRRAARRSGSGRATVRATGRSLSRSSAACGRL